MCTIYMQHDIIWTLHVHVDCEGIYDTTSYPCFESLWLKIKCYTCSIFQLHIYMYNYMYVYYVITVRQYFAIVIILADQNHVI